MKLNKNTARLLFTLLMMQTPGRAVELWMSKLFGDHMVLQQGKDLPVWGRAEPGETVTVSIGDRQLETKVGADGKWKILFPPMPVTGEAVQVRVACGGEVKVFNDVLLGDVWLCSGQSNMGVPLAKAKTAKEDIAAADIPRLRYFLIPRSVSFDPAEDVQGEWRISTPENLQKNSFSAVGYYFGASLQSDLDRPVGLIGAYDGGTRIHNWMSLESLERFPGSRTSTEKFVKDFQEKKAQLETAMVEYRNKLLPEWEALFATWKEEYDKQMSAWLAARDEARAAGQPLPPRPPRPHLPNRPLAPDGNYTLATVLFNAKIAPLMPYALTGAIWYQGEANAYPQQNEEYRHLLPMMVADWRAKWGQGDFPFLYVQLPNLISHDGDPRYKDYWPVLRESQRLAEAEIPNSAMVVTMDVGDPNDLHPTVKKPFADRLVLAAKKVAYGQDLTDSGPMIDRAVVVDGQVKLSFTSVGSGLMTGEIDEQYLVHERQEPPANFELAGEDGVFVTAEAELDGDTVRVRTDAVANPAFVRYAWADNPVPMVNLYNKEGLPASPFTIEISK